MSILARYSPESLAQRQYDDVQRRLNEAGQWPPDGLEYHVCFGSEGQLKVSEIWASREKVDAFGEHLLPILSDVGINMSSEPEFLDIYKQERY